MLEFSPVENTSCNNSSSELSSFVSSTSSCNNEALELDSFTTSTNCGGQGSQGPQGFSAYQIAVFDGFIGTEEEWLASLVGPVGPQGEIGPQGPIGLTGPGVPVGGTTGQILAKINSTNYNTEWINNFSLPTLTSGSVLFSNGTTIAQDNSNFFWDDTNNRLGIGTTSPAYKLDVNGTSRFNNDVNIAKSYNVKWGTNQQINVTDYPAYFTGGYNIMSFISNSTGVTAEDASFIWRNSGTTSNLMVLNGVGKLGIGTATPSEKLHVIGNIISSAKIEATTNIVAGGTVQSGAPAGYPSRAMKWGEVLPVSNPSLNAIGINFQQAVQIDAISYYIMLSNVLQ